MFYKFKRTEALIAAENELKMRKEALDIAKKAVLRIQDGITDAYKIVRNEHEKAIADFPKANLVRRTVVGLRPGPVIDLGQISILRKTPTGIIVGFRDHDLSMEEVRFKWDSHASAYVRIGSQKNSNGPAFLSDVSDEFMPAVTGK